MKTLYIESGCRRTNDLLCDIMLKEAKLNAHLLALVNIVEKDYQKGYINKRERFSLMMAEFVFFYEFVTIEEEDKMSGLFSYRDLEPMPDNGIFVEMDLVEWLNTD